MSDSIFSTNRLVTESAHSIPKLRRDLTSGKPSWVRALKHEHLRRHQKRTAASSSDPAAAPAARRTHTRDSASLPSTLLPLFFLRSRMIFWAILLQRGTEPSSLNLDIMDRSLQTAGLSSLKRNLKRSITGAQTSL